MEAPSLQFIANPPRSYWTLPVSREETLAIREKFRKVGWRKPNHKPKTTKVIARAKKIWDRYMALGDLFTGEVMAYVCLTASSQALRAYQCRSRSIPPRKRARRLRNLDRLDSTYHQEDDVRNHQPAVEMAVPELQHPGKTAHGLLYN